MIRDSLCLDHFYIGVSPAEFEDLTSLTKNLRRCTSTKITSGKDQWEGIYLYANIGSYFEMILDKSKYGLGLAFSAYRIQYVDVRRIKNETRELPWQQKLRLWKTTSRKWFEWLALKPLKGKSEPYQPFYAWAMHYHPLHAGQRISRPPLGNIDRFKYLKITMGESYKEYVKYHSQWLPGQFRQKKNGATILLPDRDSSNFQIDIKYVKGSASPELKILKMSLCPETNLKKFQLKYFSIKKTGTTLLLTSKRQ